MTGGGMWIPHVPRPSRVSASIAARFGPPVLEDETISDVLDRYGLRPVGSSRTLRLARRSSNVVIRTDAGRKVVKQYRPQWTPDTVRHVHSILLRLAEVRFTAPVPETAADGQTWTTIGDRVFAVYGVLPGKNYSVNYLIRRHRMRLTRIAGRTLARMHLLLEGFVPEGRHHVGLVSLAGPRRRDLDWHAAKLRELRDRSSALADPEERDLSRSLIDVAPSVLDEIGRLDDSLADVPLPRLVIHGDYGIHNLIFQRGGRAVPVDFELSRLDLRLNDIVSALVKYRYTGGVYDLASMEAFLAAYAEVFPLTSHEVDRFDEVWRSYKLQAAVQYWNSFFETNGPVRKLRSALDSIDQAAWVAAHPDVMERLARAVGARGDQPDVGRSLEAAPRGGRSS